ncbi:MAG TPA: TonB-dependent receptor, partial [Thermoanaerobaculia bacterium]
MRRWAALLSFLSLPSILAAQGIPLATLSGRVASAADQPIGGVTVTARSPSLQKFREATTLPTGEYLLPFLPPGDYVIRFAIAGMQTTERTIALAAAGVGRLDVELEPARVEESVTVSADAQAGTPLETTQVMSNYKKALTDQLPITRSLRDVALLAPGVDETGPTGNIGSANTRPALVISGAQSFESLFLVDGAVVNENIRGQPQDLFIEDAIQETTVLSGGVSAEYGRFTGGVVNVVTRAGGNQFHGSFRTSFTSDAWRALDPLEETFDQDPRIHRVDESYEATLGGAAWKDRVWFFIAGRRQSVSDSQYIFSPENAELGDRGSLLIPYTHSAEEGRAEAKLTGNITPSHNLVATYTTVRPDETNNEYLPAGDLAALQAIEAPHAIVVGNYNGILSSRLFAEAQFSRRTFTTEAGSPYSDFVRGTLVDTSRGFTLNSPAGFEGHPETFDDTSWLAKVSYLVSTENFGTHDLKTGYEWFEKYTKANFDFSGSGFILFSDAILRDNYAYPVVQNDPNASQGALEWRRITELSQGDRFLTHSAFLNDRIQWGGRLTLNLGLRYDANDARNSAGRSVSTSGAWSPRLAAQFDASGRGTVLLNAGYARYAAGLHEGIVQLFSEAGQPSRYDWFYTGPCINCDPNAPTSALLTVPQALAVVQGWYDNTASQTPPDYSRIQGLNRLVPTDGLESPTATEYSVGVGVALGAKGWARADFLYRNYDRFYDNRIDLSTGQVQGPFGETLDVEILQNSPTLDRRYEAVQTRIDYQFTPRIFAGASYTWSRLTGNGIGENGFVSAAPEFVGAYPEYQRESWSYPTGYLPGDQRNRARLWFGGTLPHSFGEVGFSVLESYASGLPYEAVGTIRLAGPDGPYVKTPGD